MTTENTPSSTSVDSIVHTPGPWKVYCDEARGRPRCLVVCQKDNEIAAINPFRESWNEDAELIAAAPEMFRIINRLATADWIGESELNLWRKECREIIDKVV